MDQALLEKLLVYAGVLTSAGFGLWGTYVVVRDKVNERKEAQRAAREQRDQENIESAAGWSLEMAKVNFERLEKDVDRLSKERDDAHVQRQKIRDRVDILEGDNEKCAKALVEVTTQLTSVQGQLTLAHAENKALTEKIERMEGVLAGRGLDAEGHPKQDPPMFPMPALGEIHRAMLSREPPSRPLAGLRVLACDDNDDARELLAVALAAYGAEVTAAANAAEVLDALTLVRFDCLALDVGLPDMDGSSLVRRIRAIEAARGFPRTPAIAVTAFDRMEDRVRAMAAGFDEFRAKPVDLDELIELIARVCGLGGDAP